MAEVDEAVVTLSAQYLTARLEERDGVTVVVLDDEATEVEISDEVGSGMLAAAALRRVAATLLARAEMLAHEGPSATWT